MLNTASTRAALIDGGPPTGRSKRFRLIAVSAALGVLLIAWLVVRNAAPKPKQSTQQSIPVNTASVTRGNLDVYLDAIGTVTPVYTVTVVSRVAGQITEVRFKEGQLVKKNDLLAVVDPRPYTAALLQAQGQRARDAAALKNARIDLVRYESSYKEHAIAEQQLATQRATVDADEGTVKLDQGDLDAAQVNVDYTSLAFNFAGILGASLAPTIANRLAAQYGVGYVGFYLSAAGMLTLGAMLLMREPPPHRTRYALDSGPHR